MRICRLYGESTVRCSTPELLAASCLPSCSLTVRTYVVLAGWQGCNKGIGGHGMARRDIVGNTDLLVLVRIYAHLLVHPQLLPVSSCQSIPIPIHPPSVIVCILCDSSPLLLPGPRHHTIPITPILTIPYVPHTPIPRPIPSLYGGITVLYGWYTIACW